MNSGYTDVHYSLPFYILEEFHKTKEKMMIFLKKTDMRISPMSTLKITQI